MIFRCTFLVLCACAALLPIAEKTVAKNARPHLPAWPAQWEGEDITQIALSDRERSFSENFPGDIAKFTDGRRDFIFRRVLQGTRQLHSSSDCFRGLGYAVNPKPAMLDARGARWSCFTAVHGEHHLLVRERITDEHGREWTDVSAWYWSVLLRQTEGPWLAVTVVDNQGR